MAEFQESPIDTMVGQAIDEVAPETPAEDGQAEEIAVEPETDEEVTATEETDEFLGKADPKDIKDPVAKKLVENLRKDYTKKMMEIGEVRTKAQAMEDLRNNPEFMDWVKSKAEAEKAKNVQQEEDIQKVVDLSQMDENERAEFIRNRFKDEIKREILKEVKKEVEPIQKTVEFQKEQSVQAQMKATADAFFSKYPDADKFRTPIAEYVRAGIDLEKAWKVVQFEQAPSKAINQARAELEAKKNANLLTVTDKSSPAKRTDKNYNSAEEATREAMAELGF